MKRILLTAIAVIMTLSAYAENISLLSPDGNIKVTVSVDEDVTWSLAIGGQTALDNGKIAMYTTNGTFGEMPKLKSVKRNSVDRTVTPVIALKQSEIRDNYNAMTLAFNGNWALEFRAYDNGAAYRFITSSKNELTVLDETAEFVLPADATAYMSYSKSHVTMYEEPYTAVKMKDMSIQDRHSYLPILFSSDNWRMMISETDLHDYPAMFLQANKQNTLNTAMPKAISEYIVDGHKQFPAGYEKHIAKTAGSRTFPWRVVTLTKDDASMVLSHLNYLLSSEPAAGSDWSWVKPGQVAWDWWNWWTITGVDFETGINTKTYQHITDFAAEYGIEYILLDEGWAIDGKPLELNPDINLSEIVSHAKAKGVGVFLWMAWDQVEMCFDTIFKQYKDWGVDGVKIDFMDRSDQWMMSWYEKVMKEATKHQLLVDFHGSITPKGLEREYPNLVSYEGVRGIENGTDCKPSNSIYLPFIRNVVGAMDFTPGSMNSLHLENAHSTPELPSGIGTRAYQMALYIVFESGVQMLADSPSAYRTAPDCTKFISETPVVWDETRVLNAELGESIVFARRSGDVWFVGGITDENSREIEISLDFLPEGKFTLTSFEDGVNANRIAKDYKKTVREVNASQKLTLKMAREGGWVGKFEPVK